MCGPWFYSGQHLIGWLSQLKQSRPDHLFQCAGRQCSVSVKKRALNVGGMSMLRERDKRSGFRPRN